VTVATPLSAQQLFDTLKREGVWPQEYRSWRTHERDDETGKMFGPVNGIVIHHTAGRDSLALCYNGTSSLPGPLCHTHLSKAGTASMLSAGRANHGGTFAQNAHDAVVAESSVHPYPDSSEPVDANDRYYGLEVENRGDGQDVYPWVQYVKAVKWATGLCRAHGWSENSVIGHKEGTRRKIDPKGPVSGPSGEQFDFAMNGFRAHVRAALAAPAGVWPNLQQEEEDVALTAEDAEKVWQSDVAYAARPPYANPDYDTNKNWTPAYGLQTAVEGTRRAYAAAEGLQVQVARLEEKVDALQAGGVDYDLLASKVADKLAARLAS